MNTENILGNIIGHVHVDLCGLMCIEYMLMRNCLIDDIGMTAYSNINWKLSKRLRSFGIEENMCTGKAV